MSSESKFKRVSEAYDDEVRIVVSARLQNIWDAIRRLSPQSNIHGLKPADIQKLLADARASGLTNSRQLEALEQAYGNGASVPGIPAFGKGRLHNSWLNDPNIDFVIQKWKSGTPLTKADVTILSGAFGDGLGRVATGFNPLNKIMAWFGKDSNKILKTKIRGVAPTGRNAALEVTLEDLLRGGKNFAIKDKALMEADLQAAFGQAVTDSRKAAAARIMVGSVAAFLAVAYGGPAIYRAKTHAEIFMNSAPPTGDESNHIWNMPGQDVDPTAPRTPTMTPNQQQANPYGGVTNGGFGNLGPGVNPPVKTNPNDLLPMQSYDYFDLFKKSAVDEENIRLASDNSLGNLMERMPKFTPVEEVVSNIDTIMRKYNGEPTQEALQEIGTYMDSVAEETARFEQAFSLMQRQALEGDAPKKQTDGEKADGA